MMENEPKMKGYRAYNKCFYPLLMEAGNTIPCGVAQRNHHEYNKEEPTTETNHPLLSITSVDVLMLRRWSSKSSN